MRAKAIGAYLMRAAGQKAIEVIWFLATIRHVLEYKAVFDRA